MDKSVEEKIRNAVREVILENGGYPIKHKEKGGKKKKKDDAKKADDGNAYSHDENLDFSVPLGDYNLYKKQGASNWGPYTAEGSPEVPDDLKESVREIASSLVESAWLPFLKPIQPTGRSVWNKLEVNFGG